MIHIKGQNLFSLKNTKTKIKMSSAAVVMVYKCIIHNIACLSFSDMDYFAVTSTDISCFDLLYIRAHTKFHKFSYFSWETGLIFH